MLNPFDKPSRPYFSSGPTVKRIGWQCSSLSGAILSRSHRSKPAMERISELLLLLRTVLEIPEKYRIALVPGSASGAVETALWNLLSTKRGVDILNWDVFSALWLHDIQKELKLVDVHEYHLDTKIDISPKRDFVFTLCGTTSGRCGQFLFKKVPSERSSIIICDAASAAFTTNIDWLSSDITAFSFQKGLGSEANYGVLVFSEHAYHRLSETTPEWPIPRLLRLKKGDEINEDVFHGHTIGTISMLCVEDCIDALLWMQGKGGLQWAIAQVEQNYQCIAEWIKQNEEYVAFLVPIEQQRSHSVACISINNSNFHKLNRADQWKFLHRIQEDCEKNGYGYEILNHTLGEPCFRIWCGPTVQTTDVAHMLNYLIYSIKKHLLALQPV